MTYYLYVQPNGLADVTDHELNLDLFPGYTFLGKSAERPNVKGKQYKGGQWVSASSEPEYVTARRAEYPPMSDYLDAVVKGDQAQIDAYIAACKAVKDKYPKPRQIETGHRKS